MNNISVLLLNIDIIILVAWISRLSLKISKLNTKVKTLEFFFKLQQELNGKQAQLYEDIDDVLKDIMNELEDDRQD